MADLKLNEELSLNNHEKIKIRNMKGSLRLVAYGKTDSFSLSASAWAERVFFGGTTVFDNDYIETVSVYGGNYLLRTLRKGKYFFIWDCRTQDSSTRQGAGIYLSSTGLADNLLMGWGGGRYRHTIQGMMFWNLEAGEEIRAKVYSNTAITCKPVQVWVFAVTGL